MQTLCVQIGQINDGIFLVSIASRHIYSTQTLVQIASVIKTICKHVYFNGMFTFGFSTTEYLISETCVFLFGHVDFDNSAKE